MSSSSVHENESENDSNSTLESSFSASYDFSDHNLSTNNTSPNTLTNTSSNNRFLENKKPYKKYHQSPILNKLISIPSYYNGGLLSEHEKQNFGDSKRKIIEGSGCFNVISPRAFNRLKLWFGSFSLMANQNDLLVHVPMDFIKRKMMGQQKKEELEREVSVLEKMLAHEQKVHEYLEELRNRQNGSAINIPNFLPPQMKELLAELSMVENEITRLESQISQLQSDVQRERAANAESKYKQAKHGPISKSQPDSSSPFPSRPNGNKAAFETKALHFINKAIKGDYNLSDEAPTQNHPKESSSQKENNFRQEQVGLFREKVSKRSGIIKPPSPLRETIRHPTPRRDRNLDTSTELPPKILATPLHAEDENVHRWPPNKLSENIMKCLIFIYIRLLRTSRVMELEKSGPIARSTNFSLSFRAETSTSSKASQMFQKDSRQQDPYSIFDSEESIPRDIGPYKNLVRFTSSSMDMKCIQNSSSVPLFQKLKVLLDGLQKVDLRFLSHQQKLAFWINMYNACIMHGFLQYGVPPVCNHENMLALINKATLNIAGNTINSQVIERFILRKPEDLLIKEILSKGDKDNKEMIVGELYGLEKPDPNIAFALCCGTRSSPAVKIYTAEGVTSELEKSKLEYLQAAIIVTRAKRIAIPELLLRNLNDFARDKDALIDWLFHQLPTSGSLRKSIVDCFRGSKAVVEKTPYDFEFQYLLTV